MKTYGQLGTLRRLVVDRRFRLPRLWSNELLRSIAPLFDGDVINVSAWQDEDKASAHYRDYFTRARSYATSNFGGYRGDGAAGSIELDLEAELPDGLRGRFDVVYNHTTLEHVFDVFAAVRNLCALSRDVVIVVVPYVQEVHTSDSFSDYWRFTAPGLRRLFEENGFEPVLLTSSPDRDAAIYHLCVASRHPERWRQSLASLPAEANDGGQLFRPTFLQRLCGYAARRLGSGR